MSASLFPRQDTLQKKFGAYSLTTPTTALRPELCVAYSIVDDAKGKTRKLSAEAAAEFEKAASAAKAKPGGIELYSGTYYAACTFGGLLACVSVFCSSCWGFPRRLCRMR